MTPLEKRPSGSEVVPEAKLEFRRFDKDINRSVRECSCGHGSTQTNTPFGCNYLLASRLIAQFPRQKSSPQRSARISFGAI